MARGRRIPRPQEENCEASLMGRGEFCFMLDCPSSFAQACRMPNEVRHLPMKSLLALVLAAFFETALPAAGPVNEAQIGVLRPGSADVTVHDAGELKAALLSLKAGTTLKIAPGDYPGDHAVQGVEGLTVEALDPRQPPHFKGGSVGWHFSRCEGLTLRNLRVSGQQTNGINLDDGGILDRPVKGVTIEHVGISDIGSRGNHDGIKGSGLSGLAIRGCTIEGWGGQGIDLVGCHRSVISGCRFTGKAGFTASAGVQLKGGTSGVTVEQCHFTNAGERPINVGGSTGMAYFRPQGAKHEASGIVVRGNVIEGGLCAAAFTGVDGAEFTGNTILFPEKWIFRILQETSAEGFAPCRNVLVKGNRVVFRRSQVQTEINIGGGTEPGTFRFENNHWFAEDRPDSSKPKLPTAEKDGVHGSDPR